MHIKFLRAGRSGQKAVAYLLRKRQDEEVIVRRGDPVFFADLVDALNYKNPYSSAVVAFSPEDRPTEEQIEEVIEGVQRTAWAGLRGEDFCVLVVEHRKKNGEGTHLHFLFANYHLSRKRYFEPAPPGWQRRYYPLRNYLNAKYGWARPDDEKRARKVQPFPGMGAEKWQVLAWAEAVAEMGLSAAEIAEMAKASGAKVPRMGTNYVTLSWGKHRVRIRTEKRKRKEVDTATTEEQERKWQRVLERIATKNREKYEQKGEREHGKAGERNGTSVTGTSRDSVRGMQAWSATGEGPGSGSRNMVVLPAHARMDVGRGPGRGIPRRMQRLGASARITREESRRNGIRIQWVQQASHRTIAEGGRGAGTPTGSVGGQTRRATAETGRPDAGMGGLWEAIERLFAHLGGALRRATKAARRLYTAACRVVAGGMSPARGAERGAEQAGQQPAARREEPKADVPRPGWPPWRQGPGWG